jgi:hypothetical protein
MIHVFALADGHECFRSQRVHETVSLLQRWENGMQHDLWLWIRSCLNHYCYYNETIFQGFMSTGRFETNRNSSI